MLPVAYSSPLSEDSNCPPFLTSDVVQISSTSVLVNGLITIFIDTPVALSAFQV